MIGFFSRTIRKTVVLAIASDSTGNSVLSEADLMVSPSVLSRGFAWQQDGGVVIWGERLHIRIRISDICKTSVMSKHSPCGCAETG